jgi:lipopolysaccharide/colanic/teichoic acid biosynthesis glycosyltransferase
MIKRAFDVTLAAAALVAASPLAVVIAALIKIEDRGPIWFGQERVGRGGCIFRAWKFRSMVPDAERITGPVQATANDPRVTRVGRLLRATAMDELPQLWNIICGDMSFVGPRPLRPGERDTTAAGVLALSEVAGYAERHSIRPGLTGLAQVYVPRDAPRTVKFRYDVEYISRQSLWLDLRLIVRSVAVTLRGAWERHDDRRYREIPDRSV